MNNGQGQGRQGRGVHESFRIPIEAFIAISSNGFTVTFSISSIELVLSISFLESSKNNYSAVGFASVALTCLKARATIQSLDWGKTPFQLLYA